MPRIWRPLKNCSSDISVFEGASLTQLSYYRSDPLQPTPLPRPLLAGAIAVVTLGLFHAYGALLTILRSPRVAFLFKISPAWLESAQWAAIFILIGIAIGRARPWIRPIVLGVMPAYVIITIGQAMLDIWLHQDFLVFPGGLPSNLAHISALVVAALIFVWFTTPQIDGAFTVAGAIPSRLAELPLPLASWAIFCIAYGFLGLGQAIVFSVRNIGASPMHARYSALSLVIALSGFGTLSRKRYALIAASLCLLIQPIQMASAVLMQLILFRQPVGRGQQPDLFLTLGLPCVHSMLILTAALVGAYCARFLSPPISDDRSVEMQDDLRQP